MGPSLSQGLALLAALAFPNVAAYSRLETVPAFATPSAGAGVELSIVTITSSYDSTYTTVRATPTTYIDTVTTCTVGSVSPTGGCQNTLFSSVGKYYSEQCDNPAVTGVVRIQGINFQDVNYCLRICNLYSKSCDMAVWDTTSTRCYLAQSSPTDNTRTTSTWTSSVQVISIYETNPCAATVTSTRTDYSTETVTTQIITVFESTVTSSALSSSSPSSSTDSSSDVSSSTTSASACSATPAAVVQESVVTLTTTYASTYTDIFTTTAASLQTVTTCTANAPTAGMCQNGVYKLGTKYYDQHCDRASLTGGATVLVLPAAQIGLCNQYCSVYSTLCSGYNYNTAARVCTFLSGSSLHFASAVAYQAVLAYTTDPCTATITATETLYSTQISSVDVTSVYKSTVTFSASATSCTPTLASETTSSSVITPSSVAMNISTSVIASNSSMETFPTTTNSTVTSMITATPLLNSTTTTMSPPITNSSITTLGHSNTSISMTTNSSVSTSSNFTNSSITLTISTTTSLPLVNTSIPMMDNNSIPTSSILANSSVALPNSTTTSSLQLSTSVPAIANRTSLTSVITSPIIISSIVAPYANTTTSVPVNIAVPATTNSSFVSSSTIMSLLPATSTVLSSTQSDIPFSKTGLSASTSSGVSTSSDAVSAASSDVFASSSTTSISSSTATASHDVSPISSSLTSSVLSSFVSPSSEVTAITLNSTIITPTTRLSTSTIFSTRIATVTACPPEVENCPARSQSTFLTTETLVLSTTVCPVIEIVLPTTTAGSSEIEYTTSTELTTRTSTITACPSIVTNCPASLQETFLITETIVVSTTVCPVSGVKTASVPAQTTTHVASILYETQSKPQTTDSVIPSSVQSAVEKHSSQTPAVSELGHTATESSAQTVTIPLTLTVVSASSVSVSSMAAPGLISGSASLPSGDLTSASPVYPEKHASAETKIVGESSSSATLNLSSSSYGSGSTEGQSATLSKGVSSTSSIATQILSGVSLATGVPQVNSTASASESTTSSYKPVSYTGNASSLQWSMSLIFGSIIAFAMIIFL